MSKNTLIRDIVVNELNDYSKNYQITDHFINQRLAYWDINRKLFDKKVSYEKNYDNNYECNYYTNFQYNY